MTFIFTHGTNWLICSIKSQTLYNLKHIQNCLGLYLNSVSEHHPNFELFYIEHLSSFQEVEFY